MVEMGGALDGAVDDTVDHTMDGAVNGGDVAPPGGTGPEVGYLHMGGVSEAKD